MSSFFAAKGKEVSRRNSGGAAKRKRKRKRKRKCLSELPS
jgi:hypothetical protein